MSTTGWTRVTPRRFIPVPVSRRVEDLGQRLRASVPVVRPLRPLGGVAGPCVPRSRGPKGWQEECVSLVRERWTRSGRMTRAERDGERQGVPLDGVQSLRGRVQPGLRAREVWRSVEAPGAPRVVGVARDAHTALGAVGLVAVGDATRRREHSVDPPLPSLVSPWTPRQAETPVIQGSFRGLVSEGGSRSGITPTPVGAYAPLRLSLPVPPGTLTSV